MVNKEKTWRQELIDYAQELRDEFNPKFNAAQQELKDNLMKQIEIASQRSGLTVQELQANFGTLFTKDDWGYKSDLTKQTDEYLYKHIERLEQKLDNGSTPFWSIENQRNLLYLSFMSPENKAVNDTTGDKIAMIIENLSADQIAFLLQNGFTSEYAYNELGSVEEKLKRLEDLLDMYNEYFGSENES